MEALGVLAVAGRDIRALRTVRADRARSGDSVRFTHRDPASPFQSAREYSLWNRLPTIHRRDSLYNYIHPGGL